MIKLWLNWDSRFLQTKEKAAVSFVKVERLICNAIFNQYLDGYFDHKIVIKLIALKKFKGFHNYETK